MLLFLLRSYSPRRPGGAVTISYQEEQYNTSEDHTHIQQGISTTTFQPATIPAFHQKCDYPMRNKEWL